MSRKFVTIPKTVIEGTTVSTDQVGETTTCEQLDELRYLVMWSNGSSLNATFTAEVSDDNINWDTLDLSTPMNLSGTSGKIVMLVRCIIFKYIRPRITFSAGSCDLLSTVKAKTISA